MVIRIGIFYLSTKLLPLVEKQKVCEKIHRLRFQDWWLSCTEPDIS